MRTHPAITGFLAASLFLTGCAPSRFVKPLRKNEQAASFSFGGPLIKFSGAPIPIPFSTVAYGYGLNNSVTAFGAIHSTSLLFGNLQTDIGATFNVFERENHFGLSLSPALQAAYHVGAPGSLRIWPSADLNFYYHPQKKASYLYAGCSSWFELSRQKAHGEAIRQRAVPSIQTGYMRVNGKWLQQFQLGYLAPGTANLPGVVEYIGISGKGAFSFHYSIIRCF